jgi:hypothetical protein
MNPQRTKWVRFWLVFAIWLAADLWSKHWADTTLATPAHPLLARGPRAAAASHRALGSA